MKVDLFINGISDTRKMSGCSKGAETFCGIQYRLG